MLTPPPWEEIFVPLPYCVEFHVLPGYWGPTQPPLIEYFLQYDVARQFLAKFYPNFLFGGPLYKDN